MLSSPLDKYPDIDFLPVTVDEILTEMITTYERIYQEETGETIKVLPASEARIHLYANAYMFYMERQRVNQGLKMNLLKYSKGEYLENLAAWFGITRNESKPAYTTVEFELSEIQSTTVNIPAGTRVSTSNSIFFITTKQAEIKPGSKTTTVNVQSLISGEETNNLPEGSIKILVDPIPFVAKVKNIKATQGGSAIETDEQLRTRIYMFPDSFSTAGPIDAYTYFAFEFSQAIKNVKVTTPKPGHVDVKLTLTGDVLPEEAFLDELYHYLNDKNKRPLTDYLKVAAPDIANYNINFTYYIGYENQDRIKEIQENIAKAVNDYISWQGEEIGRDINPNVLIRNLIDAGAKRADILSPVFTIIKNTDIAQLSKAPTGIYGGVEDD